MQQDISSVELAKLQGPMSTMLRSHNQNYEEISFNKKVFKNVSIPHPKKKIRSGSGCDLCYYFKQMKCYVCFMEPNALSFSSNMQL